MVRERFELHIHGRRVVLGERTLLMGVVNVTPDSFSDGGRFLDPLRAVEHAQELVRQGADWIDVGGESTRPGSQPISHEEELRRVLPVIQGLRRKLRAVPISIDTTKAAVAEAALSAGAGIVNDVSGLRFDPDLAKVAKQVKAPIVLMHLRGRPETMQKKPFARDIWRSLHDSLARSIRVARAAGMPRSQIIIDPGLGFGKSRRQNYEILAHLVRLRKFHLPILAGTSRKSFVQAIVNGKGLDPEPGKKKRAVWPLLQEAESRHGAPLLAGDAAAVAVSILAGAHIVRVHDVATALPAVRIADAVLAAQRRP